MKFRSRIGSQSSSQTNVNIQFIKIETDVRLNAENGCSLAVDAVGIAVIIELAIGAKFLFIHKIHKFIFRIYITSHPDLGFVDFEQVGKVVKICFYRIVQISVTFKITYYAGFGTNERKPLFQVFICKI